MKAYAAPRIAAHLPGTPSHLGAPIGIRPQVAIGIVGPHDLVDRLVALAAQAGPLQWRLVAAAHKHERDTYDSLRKIEETIDVALFAGQLQYELARASGPIAVPATYLPLSGAELFAPLVNAVMSGVCDPRRISIDSLDRNDIEEVFEDINVPSDKVKSLEYSDAESVAGFAEFHERLYRAGRTTAAFTGVWSVAERLRAAGVPTFRTLPTTSTLRSALNVAALLGAGGRLEESQVTIAIVRLGQSMRAKDPMPSDYSQQELRLALNQTLVKSARPIGASVRPIDESSYLVTMTFGSLFKATDGFQRAPFIGDVESSLGIPVDVGIGLGRTVRDAEAHAFTALGRASTTKSGDAFVIDAARKEMRLPSGRSQAKAPEEPVGTKGEVLATRLAAFSGGIAPVVDAAQVAKFLKLTPRSARRVLHDLVSEGLAWPIAPAVSKRAGRPRQLYRLVIHDLGSPRTTDRDERSPRSGRLTVIGRPGQTGDGN